MDDDFAALGLTLWTTDIDALAGFLERVVGLTVLAKHPGFASLRCGDSKLSLHADEASRGHPWYEALQQEGVARGIGAEIRIEVADVDECWKRAAREGALVVQTPYSPDGQTRECHLLGPDGYLITPWDRRGDNAN